MSYIDETYGKQLEEALRGLVSRPALGQPWFGFHASEVPAGVLLFTATTHSRVLYADFWKYIQDKNLVKTEEEWQSIYNEQGWCPFYSDGDGIDTFRMPSAPLYLHGAGTLSEAGQYIEAGLPNINGTLSGYDLTGPETGTSTGALYVDSSITTVCGASVASDYTSQLVGFDASLSNPIYGNSSTVTPKTSKMLFGVWAISAPQQPIPDATVEGIISELSVASNNALEAKNGLNGVVRSINGVNADAAGNVSDVENIYKGNSQYAIRFTNGLQLVWGYVNIPANQVSATVTMPYAYVARSYFGTATPNVSDGGQTATIASVSTSSFKVAVLSLTGTYDWTRTAWYITVGYWK